jgi:uncharacterized protein (AIM24 family)
MAALGFEILVPPVPSEGSIPYTITGAESQVVSFTLKPGQRVTGEPGTMLLMSDNTSTDVKFGGCQRCCTGEAPCIVRFHNEAATDGFVSLTPNFPGKVIPVQLRTVGGTFISQGGAYFASTGDVSVTADCDCCSCSCCFGGMGMIRQKSSGTGTLFMTASGTVLTKTLADGEVLLVDTNSVVGFQETVKMGVKSSGGCCNCCCGGEGLFNTRLTGPGMVVIQSMSEGKYKRAVAPPPPPPSAVGNA